MAEVRNQCAGPFGAAYDFYIEREWLARPIGRLIWGIDVGPLYSSLKALSELPGGSTVLDVPSGGGLALRALPRRRRIRYVAVDLSEKMLERLRRRAEARGLDGVETVNADMCDLPFEESTANLFLAYSGLHMIDDPRAAVAEMARVLKPGGRVIGTTFTTDGTRRANAMFAAGARSGHAALTASGPDVAGWLEAAGLEDVDVSGRGFVLFRARKPAA